MRVNNFFESLESRQLRTVTLSSGVVEVTGTTGADLITFQIDDVGPGALVQEQLVVYENGTETRFNMLGLFGPQVTSIEVDGQGGTMDWILAVDGGDGMLDIPMSVTTGGGPDRNITGNGNDTEI